jgi:hypothetical protein
MPQPRLSVTLVDPPIAAEGRVFTHRNAALCTGAALTDLGVTTRKLSSSRTLAT